MTAQRRANLDDLLAAIESITDKIKVLVSAVDDLRCEIEWQGRNSSNEDSPTVSASAEADNEIEDEGEPAGEITPPDVPDDSLLSAAGRLRAFERSCSQGARTPWSDEWATGDDFEIPAGRLVSVGADLWSAMLDIRPAHVIGEGCCCEEGIRSAVSPGMAKRRRVLTPRVDRRGGPHAARALSGLPSGRFGPARTPSQSGNCRSPTRIVLRSFRSP